MNEATMACRGHLQCRPDGARRPWRHASPRHAVPRRVGPAGTAPRVPRRAEPGAAGRTPRAIRRTVGRARIPATEISRRDVLPCPAANRRMVRSTVPRSTPSRRPSQSRPPSRSIADPRTAPRNPRHHRWPALHFPVRNRPCRPSSAGGGHIGPKAPMPEAGREPVRSRTRRAVRRHRLGNNRLAGGRQSARE